jgi:hypothetical protein
VEESTQGNNLHKEYINIKDMIDCKQRLAHSAKTGGARYSEVPHTTETISLPKQSSVSGSTVLVQCLSSKKRYEGEPLLPFA